MTKLLHPNDSVLVYISLEQPQQRRLCSMKTNDMKKTEQTLKHSEVWQQNIEHLDFWHGPNGVIINTAALNEREFYYNVIRITAQPYIRNSYSRLYV